MLLELSLKCVGFCSLRMSLKNLNVKRIIFHNHRILGKRGSWLFGSKQKSVNGNEVIFVVKLFYFNLFKIILVIVNPSR